MTPWPQVAPTPHLFKIIKSATIWRTADGDRELVEKLGAGGNHRGRRPCALPRVTLCTGCWRAIGIPSRSCWRLHRTKAIRSIAGLLPRTTPPYLFPRLSAAVIDARHTVERIDSTDLIARLSDRIARLAPPELCGGSRGGGRVTATSHSLKLSVCKFIRQWNVWGNYLAMKDLAVRAIVSMSCSRVTHTYRPKRAPRKL